MNTPLRLVSHESGTTKLANPTGTTQRKPFVAKGHDVAIQDAQQSQCMVRIITMQGEALFGTVVRRDKFTITLRHSPVRSHDDDAGLAEVIYKHAIARFAALPDDHFED